MIEKAKIEQLVGEKIQGTHLFLVEVTVTTQNAISVFLDSEQSVTLEDCIEINKFIEANFDREEEDYELSVSSAGLTEPLKVPRQFTKSLGKEVSVVTGDGQKRTGTLVSYNDGAIELEILKKVKLEGSNKKQQVIQKEGISLSEIKSVVINVKF